jgi:hypothetical protein
MAAANPQLHSHHFFHIWSCYYHIWNYFNPPRLNERTESMGKRGLYTVKKRLLESVSYEAAERAGDGNGTVTTDAKYV